MFRANIVGGEQRNKRRRSGGFLDVGSAISLFALHQAHHSDDLETIFAGGLDRLNCRSAGGADIIDDHHPRRLSAKALDALAGAVTSSPPCAPEIRASACRAAR